MLEVCPARDEGNFHIRQRRTGQHAHMLLFFQVGQHKALPVLVQHFLAAVGGKLQPAAPGQGFQQQMHLGVVAQGFVVAHALHGLGDGLLIKDAPGAELHVQPEALGQQAAQHFQLHLAHELDVDLTQRLVPHNVQLGFLLLQPVQLAQSGVHVGPLRQQHLVTKHRLQHGQVTVPLGTKALARACLGQAGDGAHLPRADAFGQRILCTGVQPQLVGLFGPGGAVHFAGELGFHLQFPAGDPQPGQPRALLVLRDLEHPGTKGIQRRGRAGEAVQPGQKLVHAVQTQRRAEPAREHMPPRHSGHNVGIGQLPGFQLLFHELLVAQGQRLVPGGLCRAEIHEALPQPPVQLGQQFFPAQAGQVGLVHEHERGHPVAPQQPPERLGVALHTVGGADHQHRVVQHLQGALGLGGEIHMAGGVQQGDVRAARRQQRLLGKNGDAARLFQRVGIQKGVLVVHAAQLADGTGAVEHGLREGGLAGVHMGQDAQNDLFAGCFFHRLLLSAKILFYCSTMKEKRKAAGAFCRALKSAGISFPR